MAQQVIEITCPGCGARVSTDQKVCEYCRGPLIISTFNSVYSMPMPEVNKYAGAYKKALSENPGNQELNNSIAFCYLKLGYYDKALACFENAMEDNFDNSETFFYAAVCVLHGSCSQPRKAFLLTRPEIDEIEKHIKAALMIEPKGIYHYFWAYIKYDYFSRKYFNTSPTWQEALANAKEAGLSDYDVQQLYEIINVPKPEAL